jgi:hypothetical protein
MDMPRGSKWRCGNCLDRHMGSDLYTSGMPTFFRLYDFLRALSVVVAEMGAMNPTLSTHESTFISSNLSPVHDSYLSLG